MLLRDRFLELTFRCKLRRRLCEPIGDAGRHVEQAAQLLSEEERWMSATLNAAALTYLAAFIGALLNLLYLISRRQR